MRSRRLQVGRLAALALAGALALTGCTGDDGGSADENPTGADDAVGTGGADGGADAGAGSVARPTAPADIPAAAGERSASGGGTTVTIEADQAGFVLPSGNIACSVTADGAVCQIDEKQFTPSADHLSETNIAGCTAEDANAMRLAAGRGAWTCVTDSVVGQARIDTGGWWADQVGGEALDVDGTSVAVLPYGSTLTVGPVSCTSAEAGVSCSSTETGRSFTLAGTTYNYG